MTKGELKKALDENLLPDDSEVLIAVGERNEESTWNEIGYVDETGNGVPILIGTGRMIMEQGEIQHEQTTN